MAKLPSRKELADKIDELESRLLDFTAGAGTGAILARSPTARAAAGRGVARLGPYGALGDLVIRQEESIPFRAGKMTIDELVRLAEGAETFQRQSGVTLAQPVTAPTVPVTKRTPNKFSKAVGKGMKALKASKSYGKKGGISNAKAAFKTATKAASARLKGRKMPKSGPSKIAYKAAKTVYTDEILRRKK